MKYVDEGDSSDISKKRNRLSLYAKAAERLKPNVIKKSLLAQDA